MCDIVDRLILMKLYLVILGMWIDFFYWLIGMKDFYSWVFWSGYDLIMFRKLGFELN